MPTHIGWIHGDPAMYYVVWAMFRLSTGIHWPITWANALGYPIGESIARADGLPLVALLLRPFSAWLPARFQYLGLYAILSLGLQLYFGVRLVRALAPGRKAMAWAGGILFMIAPPLTYRIGGHFTLASQWLILAALLLYWRGISEDFSVRRYGLLCVLLMGAALGLNPNISLMVLPVLLAACVAAALKHGAGPVAGLGLVAAVAAAFIGFSAMFGLHGGSRADLVGPGYRYLSMNLLEPISPDEAHSPILPTLPRFAGQYEGYSYLGAGTLALLAVGGWAALRKRGEIRWRDVANWGPLAACCLCLTALALSTLVTAGRHVLVDVDPSQRLTPWLSVQRASGRLFWVPYYALTLAAVVWTIRFLKPRYGAMVLVGAVALQFFDTASLRGAVRARLETQPAASPLVSPVWRELGREHKHLAMEPPWQCRGETAEWGDTAGRADGYRIFGELAAEDGLTINSYYAGRYRRDDLTYHCHTAINQLVKQGMEAGTVYVLSAQMAAAVVGRGAGASGHCYSVDGFLLCTKDELEGVTKWDASDGDPGIPAAPSTGRALTERDAGLLASGWGDVEPGLGAWAVNTQAVIAYREPERGARSLRLRLMAVAGKNPVRFSVVYEGGSVDSAIASTSPGTIREFVVRVPIGKGPGVHEVTVVTDQLRTPAEQGYNDDTRKMGIGIHAIAASDCGPAEKVEPAEAACGN